MLVLWVLVFGVMMIRGMILVRVEVVVSQCFFGLGIRISWVRLMLKVVVVLMLRVGMLIIVYQCFFLEVVLRRVSMRFGEGEMVYEVLVCSFFFGRSEVKVGLRGISVCLLCCCCILLILCCSCSIFFVWELFVGVSEVIVLRLIIGYFFLNIYFNIIICRVDDSLYSGYWFCCLQGVFVSVVDFLFCGDGFLVCVFCVCVCCVFWCWSLVDCD